MPAWVAETNEARGETAAAVLGEWQRQRIGVDIQVRFWDLYSSATSARQRSMKVEDVEREWAQGRNMTFDEAITLALAD